MSALGPDTTLALLQASQGSTGEVSKNLKALGKSKDPTKIDQAAEDFEAMFISEMIKPMFEGISTDGPFGGGKGEEVFRSFLLQEYGKLMAKTGDIGLSAHVRNEMIKAQEQASNEDPGLHE